MPKVPKLMDLRFSNICHTLNQLVARLAFRIILEITILERNFSNNLINWKEGIIVILEIKILERITKIVILSLVIYHIVK